MVLPREGQVPRTKLSETPVRGGWIWEGKGVEGWRASAIEESQEGRNYKTNAA